MAVYFNGNKVNIATGLIAAGNDKALIEKTITGTYTVPDGVEYIGEYGLAGQKGITELIIPSNVTSLAPYALYDMSGLKRFTIPYSVTGLGNYSCYNLSTLEEVVYDANIPITKFTSAGDFRIFTWSTGRFVIGENTVGIPDYLFSGSSTYTINFKNIVCDRNKATTIGQKLLGGGESTYLRTVWLDCKANALTLKSQCFRTCTYLSNCFLNFSTSSLTSSTQPFYRAGSQTGIALKLGENVTTVPQYLCYDAYLENAYIPSNVTQILAGAFNTGGSSYQSKVTGITIDRTTPPNLANTNAFLNTNNCPIYVPAESVEAYQGATNWSTYASRITALSYENYTDGTNTLILGNNLWFDLIVDGVAYNGTYSTNTSGTITFIPMEKDVYRTFTGTIADGVATIRIDGTTYTLTLGA